MNISEPITLALSELAGGDQTAIDRLLPFVYAELRKLAGHYLRQERDGHTLQPTALVHEAYLRIFSASPPTFQNRAHFLGVSAHIMREILIEHARGRNAAKRGGGQVVLALDECMDAPLMPDSTVLRVEDALRALEVHDPLKGRLIEMRFFGGMTAEESSALLQLSLPRVRNELRVAQAWLRRELDMTHATAE